MMGVGTPTAWQVNVTVAPRAASTDSSGRLVTEGGAVGEAHKDGKAVFRRETRKEEPKEKADLATYCSRTRPSGRDSRALRHTGSWPGCRFGRSGIRTARGHIGLRAPWWLEHKEDHEPGEAWLCCWIRKADVRQSISSELSSQSLSPSQRHSFRAQRPFLHLNSLGSQGEGVPAGETTAIQPRAAV